jgi:hypothetical protein
MARFWTYSEIKAKILRDLDCEDESFVQPSELLDYVNEAIDEAEAEIHSIYEDYFLTSATITLVSGTDAYSLPSDIYAQKIRAVLYKNGSTVTKIKRLPASKKFDIYTDNLTTTESAGNYDYFLKNTTAGTPQIVFTPPPAESGAYITVWYLRNANRLTLDASVCDIPEFVSFVIQYVKVRVYEKEGHPNLSLAVAGLAHQRQMMTDTLTAMVPDGDNLIEADLSHYHEAV